MGIYIKQLSAHLTLKDEMIQNLIKVEHWLTTTPQHPHQAQHVLKTILESLAYSEISRQHVHQLLNETAQTLYDQGRYKQAIVCYNIRRNLLPDDPITSQQLNKVKQRQEKTPELASYQTLSPLNTRALQQHKNRESNAKVDAKERVKRYLEHNNRYQQRVQEYLKQRRTPPTFPDPESCPQSPDKPLQP